MSQKALRAPSGALGGVSLAILSLLAFGLGLGLALAMDHAYAQQQSAEFSSRAKQAILMEGDSGAVLYQVNADQLMHPGNMSKLMTLAVAFKALKAGDIHLQDEILVSENAWRKGGAPSQTTSMFVDINTKARLEELLQGLVIQTANDSAIAIAESMAGSEDAFAKLMEKEARLIGLKKSKFRNATGYFNLDHVMTVREIALLARVLIRDYPERYTLFSQKDFQYQNLKHKQKFRFVNRNPLMGVVDGTDGLMTGYGKESGYGMVVSAVQGGRRLIAVVGGLASEKDRSEEARKILEWGFRSFVPLKLFEPGEIVGSARVWGGDRMYVPLVGKNGVMVLLPRTAANQKLKRAEIVYFSPLKAPIAKGDEVAILRVTSASGATNEAPLLAAEDVKRGGVMRRGVDSLYHMMFGWIAF